MNQKPVVVSLLKEVVNNPRYSWFPSSDCLIELIVNQIDTYFFWTEQAFCYWSEQIKADWLPLPLEVFWGTPRPVTVETWLIIANK